jgi:hypothetical protein
LSEIVDLHSDKLSLQLILEDAINGEGSDEGGGEEIPDSKLRLVKGEQVVL